MNTKISKIITKYKQNNIIFLILIILILLCIFFCIYKYIKYKYNGYNKYNEYFYSEYFYSENIIIPDIIGGLGNQLFVVAAAFAYSKDNNYKLMLDNRKDVFSYGKPRQTYNDTVFYNIPVSNDIKKDDDFVNLNESEYASSNGKNGENEKNIFLTGGYYQEAKYFNKYRKELLDLLEPTSDTSNKVNQIFRQTGISIGKDFLIAIHIRLDDVYTPIDADKRVYDKDEYDIIIQKLPEHLKANPNTKFIIFSNDVPRTKEIFKSAQIDKSRMIYIQSEDYVELALMAKCNSYIASPSTFNWWGIYLNKSAVGDIFIYWKQDSNYRKDFYTKYEYLKEKLGFSLNNLNSIETFSNFNNNNNTIISNFTCVSGFWKVNNKHGNKFNDWFKNTLAINCPYLFFTNKDNINYIKKFRKQYPTYFIEKDINDFKTYKLNIKNKIHNTHVPSKYLGLIWLEKMNLVLEASIINPYHSEWFCWIDSGICIYRDKAPTDLPFPNPDKIHLLSKTQINYCTSENISNDDLNKIKNWEYVHNVSGNFIIHISFINQIHNLFYKYLDICISETNEFTCYSEQCILSRIYVDYPNLFNKIGDNYGQIILELT